jgi:hypothetical protein
MMNGAIKTAAVKYSLRELLIIAAGSLASHDPLRIAATAGLSEARTGSRDHFVKLCKSSRIFLAASAGAISPFRAGIM